MKAQWLESTLQDVVLTSVMVFCLVLVSVTVEVPGRGSARAKTLCSCPRSRVISRVLVLWHSVVVVL